jgi:hypothetical protein
MRKVILLAVALVFASAVLTSCRSHQKCPAYGKANTEAESKVNI